MLFSFKNNKFIRAARRLRRHKVLIIEVLYATCGARQEGGQGPEGNTQVNPSETINPINPLSPAWHSKTNAAVQESHQ